MICQDKYKVIIVYKEEVEDDVETVIEDEWKLIITVQRGTRQEIEEAEISTREVGNCIYVRERKNINRLWKKCNIM